MVRELMVLCHSRNDCHTVLLLFYLMFRPPVFGVDGVVDTPKSGAALGIETSIRRAPALLINVAKCSQFR